MSRKRGYKKSTVNCGYKSVKFYNKELIERFDALCRRKNSNWETLSAQALWEFLESHENDDLENATIEQLKIMVAKLRGEKYKEVEVND